MIPNRSSDTPITKSTLARLAWWCLPISFNRRYVGKRCEVGRNGYAGQYPAFADLFSTNSAKQAKQMTPLPSRAA